MYKAGESVRSPRGTVIDLLDNDPERLRIRRTMPPATGKGVPHMHENGVETFRVLEGEVTASLDGTRRVLRAGDELVVPIGSSHVHPHTASDRTAVLEHTIEPCPQFVQVYFMSWMGWLDAGRVNGQDEPSFLAIMGVIHHGGGGTWIKGPPIAAQRLLARTLAPVAATRGYAVST